MCDDLTLCWLVLLLATAGHSVAIIIMVWEREKRAELDCARCQRRELLFQVRGQTYRVLHLLQISVMGELALASLGFLYQLIKHGMTWKDVDVYMLGAIALLAALILGTECWLGQGIASERRRRIEQRY